MGKKGNNSKGYYEYYSELKFLITPNAFQFSLDLHQYLNSAKYFLGPVRAVGDGVCCLDSNEKFDNSDKNAEYD